MSARSDIHILVLDDEPFMLKLLARLLTNLGFTNVATCDNGQAALGRWAESKSWNSSLHSQAA